MEQGDLHLVEEGERRQRQRIAVFQHEDGSRAAEKQYRRRRQHDFAVQRQMPEASPFFRAEPPANADDVPPDDIPETPEHNQSFRNEIHHGVRRIIAQAVLPDDIHSGIAESRDGIENGDPDPPRAEIRDQYRHVEERPYRLDREGADNHLFDKPHHAGERRQIECVTDQQTILQPDFPVQYDHHPGDDRNHPEPAYLDQQQDDHLPEYAPRSSGR